MLVLPFDPQAAEVTHRDEPLPPVPLDALSASALRGRFQMPPSWSAEFAGDNRVAIQQLRPASVLVPLVMRPEPTVLLTQRPQHLKAHGGQISFPGGRQEPSDASVVHTALRETEEEVGLQRDRVEVLGTLPPYLTVTGFMVTPVVGLIEPWDLLDPGTALRHDPGEVDEIFEVPLHFLMNPAHHEHRARVLPDPFGRVEFLAMPWTPPHAAQPYFIWGATAAMLRNLYRFLSA